MPVLQGPVPAPTASASTTVLEEHFTDDRRPGRVVGSRTPDGVLRGGVDREGIISIDNGALRIPPLLEPGWGRAGIAYGPFRREAGLALAVFMLNGHNASHTQNLSETFRHRLARWLIGSETYRIRQRVLQWMQSRRKLRTLRQVRWWRRIHKDAPPVAQIDENLAVGWFAREVPIDPLTEGNAFVMHASGPENGELWVRVGLGCMPVVRGVQNVQIYYVVVLRERGAIYYAASVPNANGLPGHPQIRPVAVDPFSHHDELYAGIHQSVLGQIGFRLDSRVYGLRVARVPEFARWYGAAHAADALTGVGDLGGSSAEVGGRWSQGGGRFVRSARGTHAVIPSGTALLDPGVPSGLVHALLETYDAAAQRAGIVWRADDIENFWCLSMGLDACELWVTQAGVRTLIARSEQHTLAPNRTHSVQILDDGRVFSAHLDGRLLFDRQFSDLRLNGATGVGMHAPGAADGIPISGFEAHPRHLRLPDALDSGAPWCRAGEEMVAADDFEGRPGDLAGRTTSTGGKVWRRSMGRGVFVAGDGAARIQASVERPNPGRTLYTISWDYPDFADLEVEISPAGTARGHRHHGLCGFVFWQDPRNYFTINIWRYDSYGGASISTFFQLDGFEDLYDAIWTNVGDRVFWGRPTRLRTTFDGMRYTAFLDDEPVLYRALTDVYPDSRPMAVTRVGLIANWEWGNDTGSVFRRFRARR